MNTSRLDAGGAYVFGVKLMYFTCGALFHTLCLDSLSGAFAPDMIHCQGAVAPDLLLSQDRKAYAYPAIIVPVEGIRPDSDTLNYISNMFIGSLGSRLQ